jgi:hypothetical protein
MTEDPRCCGSGTCIIDDEGRCWCGQQWDGQKMCHVPMLSTDSPGRDSAARPAQGNKVVAADSADSSP